MSGSRRLGALVGALLLAATAVACGSDDDSQGAPSDNGDAPADAELGGSLVIGRNSDTVSLDTQYLVNGEDIMVKRLLWSPLVDIAPDGSGVEPGLAEDWEFDEESNTYTFHLREATFSDGTPVTSADAKFSLEYSAEGGDYGELLSRIESIDTPDDRTVVVHLDGVDNLFLTGAAFGFVIPEDFGGQPAEDFFADPVSSGPFVLESWTPNDRMVMARNDEFWDPERPGVDTLEWRIISDANQRLVAFQAGDIDIYEYVPHQLASAVPEDALVELDPTARVLLLVLNNARAPFDDQAAREAAGLAINRKELVETVWNGRGTVPDGIIQPGVPDQPSDADRWVYDAERAEELMSSVSNTSMRLLAPNQREVEPTVTQAIQDDLASVGFDIELETPDYGAAIDQFLASDFDAFLLGNGAYLPSAGEPMIVYANIIGPPASWPNFERVSELLEEFRSAASDEDRQAAAVAFEDYIAETDAIIPVAAPHLLFAVSERVQGFTATPAGLHQPDRFRVTE